MNSEEGAAGNIDIMGHEKGDEAFQLAFLISCNVYLAPSEMGHTLHQLSAFKPIPINT